MLAFIPETVYITRKDKFYTRKGKIFQKQTMKSALSEFVKQKRKKLKLTQPELAGKAGVGLRFVRDVEQGKKSMRMDKVNQVLILFGYELGAVKKESGD